MFRKLIAALIVCSSALSAIAVAQDCSPPAIVANAKADNMFTPEQEMVFGDLTLENMASDMRFVRDEALVAYVNEIGARIIKHLPPTGLRFQFHIVDIPEANAFNIPGGHVLLSRKLIAYVNNEDELAGVVAHELGHAVVHHSATDVSAALKKILNVTSLGDRKDITEKYNLLIERARTKSFSRKRDHEDAQQLEADKIGLFAMASAGYDPASFYSFFDRLAETEGKTGSWFSDLFGKTRPDEKRLREMIHLTELLPATCRDRAATKANENFLKWQADVVTYRETARREDLPGLVWKRELAPKLRSDVSHFAFSPDGRLLLAQDDYAVTVIQRDPAQVLFQIPVEGADDASFTADGKFIIFSTESLRYEKWSVEERKPVEVRELVLRQDCWEHKLSPDGNYIACVDTALTAKVLDIRTSKKVWEKKDFYQLNFFEFFAWVFSKKEEEKSQSFFRIEFSPDSRYVMFSRSEKFRFRLSINGMTEAQTENTALALDLTTLKPVDLGGDVKKIASRAYAFVEPDKLLGSPSMKIDEAGIFTFPTGKRLQKFTFAAQEIERTANPDYVVIRPLANVKLGVFDMKKGTIVSGLDKEDAAFYGNVIAYESLNGKVLIRETAYNEAAKKFDFKDLGTIDIPVSALKTLNAAEVSDDFNWLMLSSKTRGGLWNLSTGERKIYVRGFRGGIVANDGGGVADFPTAGDVRHSLVLMNANNNTVAPIRELPEKGARQFGRFVLVRRSLNAQGDGESDSVNLGSEVRFELKDFIQDKVIWSRDFPKEAPEYSFDEFSGRLILYWRLGSNVGKAKLKESAELKAKADALGNKADDYLVEVVDAFAQKTVGQMLLETGKGSFDVGEGLSEGDWLVLHDSEGRMLVYSIKEGDLRHRFFGGIAAINPRRNQVAVENFPGEVALYDLNTGDRRANFRINGSAAFVRFNLEGSKLFVLSDTQAVYSFDLNKLDAKATAQAN